MEAIVAAKGIPKALLPHLTPLLEVVPDGDSFKVLVKSDPGKKLGDFVAGLKGEMPWGFEPSGANGGGSPAGGGAQPAAKSISRAQFDTLSPDARFAHTKAGGVVTD